MTTKQPTGQEEIFTNPTSDRGLVFNIYKELKKLYPRESKSSIKNGVQDYTETSQWRVSNG